ncbi:VP2 [LI polyomavirus]|uniref:Minor capsid protein VP2 n=2 Tax=LI polyomavirus TaxID=1965344 RepID=A0A1W2KRP7_9POLY|nr:VP2 [LI polyomavirus]AQX36238.1 VP2 [LI polyomavirus]DBA09027.1 TPA_asm: VP2 [Cat associated lyon-IARC polyomavirus]
MGGFISLVLSVAEIATELSAATGFAVDAIVSGEALAAIEAEVASLMTIEGLSGAEALAQLGYTAEQFSNFSLVSSLMNQAIGYGTLFQTVTGVSSLVAAGIKLSLQDRSIIVTPLSPGSRNNIPGMSSTLTLKGHPRLALEFYIDPLNYNHSMLNVLGQKLWESIAEEHKTLGIYTNKGKLLELARWEVRGQNSNNLSGNMVYFPPPNGGANQQTCPDWLLPLVLGLSGTVTSTWENLQDGPQEKSF